MSGRSRFLLSVAASLVPVAGASAASAVNVGQPLPAFEAQSLQGVNSNHWESRQEVADHAHERGFGFPMIKDDGHVIADRLGADRTPEAFLVDSEGKLRYRGWVKSKQESPDLQHALDAVLEGRRVRRPVTKAFGCAVDRF